MNFDSKVLKIVNDAEEKLKDFFAELENIAFLNQKKVLQAFQNNNVALRHFPLQQDMAMMTLAEIHCAKFLPIFFTPRLLLCRLLLHQELML